MNSSNSSIGKAILVMIACAGVFFGDAAFADDAAEPDLWGIAIGVRSAKIPYATDADRVNDVVPLLFYEQGRLFIRGLEAGFILYNVDRWRFSAIGRYRFFDIPADYQNEIRGNAFDMGGQVRYTFTDYFNTDAEVLSDRGGRISANLTANFRSSTEALDLLPYATLRWKSDDFNDTYYGLNRHDSGNAFDLSAGLEARYHVYRNFYLVGKAGLTALDNRTYDLNTVDDRVQSELYFGIGFFKDRTEEKKTLKSKPYIRVAHGWATPSNIGDIIAFQTEKDPYNNQLTSIFYGAPVSDALMGLPIQLYLTPGFVWHNSSEVQDGFPEYVLAMKAYYTVDWPTTWRFGFAEGLSYTTRIPYIENSEMERKGYRPSNLLNFLDFSLDFSLGDLFKVKRIENLWLGYSIHHRSGIFARSSAFGRISGGSNYNTVYLQYHF